MKQVISRLIQACVVIAGLWYLQVPKAFTWLASDFSEEEKAFKAIESKYPIEDQEILAQENFQMCLDKVQQAKAKLEATNNPDYYFEAIYIIDSLAHLDYMRTSNGSRFLLRIDQAKEPLFQVFHEKVISKKMHSESINISRDKFFPHKKTENFSQREIHDFLKTAGRKMFFGYLFFGFLIIIASINRVWRNHYNDVLFDPRDRKDFWLGILAWPLRVFFWVRGEVQIRKYRDDVFTILTKEEKTLLKEYIESFGKVSFEKYFKAKGIQVRHSFGYALLGCILGIFIFSIEVYPQNLKEKEKTSITSYHHGPPIVKEFFLKSLSDLWKGIHEQEKTIIQEKIIQHFVYSFSYTEIFQKVPWHPPRSFKVIFF